jgi:hypothetical protein
LGLQNTSDTPVIIGSNNNDFVVMTGTGGAPSERFRVEQTGRVGIGNATPAAQLDVLSAITSSIASFKSTYNGTTYISISNTANTPVRIGSEGNNFVIRTGSSGTPSERFRVDQTGNVGIGTISPSSMLHVMGAVQVGPDGTSCVSQKFGAIRFDSNQLQYCDASMTWRTLLTDVMSESSSSGSFVDFLNYPSVVLNSVGASTITLSNMVMGKSYELIVEDTTSRTYTFSGCGGGTYFSPANAATTAGQRTIYKIRYTMSSKCYIEWKSYQ